MYIDKTCHNSISPYVLKSFTVVFFVAISMLPTPLLALKEIIVSGKERNILSDTISRGRNDIIIRASTIHDTTLISAIRKGASNKKIRVLIDNSSQEIGSLIGVKNVQIRMTKKAQHGKFNKYYMSQSFVIETGKKGYLLWFGSPVWKKDVFGNYIRLFTASGFPSCKGCNNMLATFDREFSNALVIESRLSITL